MGIVVVSCELWQGFWSWSWTLLTSVYALVVVGVGAVVLSCEARWIIGKANGTLDKWSLG